MIFSYQKKLEKYQEYMNYLNENIFDTIKIINLINYARENEIINSKNIIYGELNAIYDFYLRDMIKYMELMNSCDDNNKKEEYLKRIDADNMLIDSISEDNHVKDNYLIINDYLSKVNKLEKSINVKDKISLNLNKKFKSR